MVQPFKEDGYFRTPESIKKGLSQSISLIERQAVYIGRELKAKTILKIFDQIPDIQSGITSWQQWAAEKTAHFIPELDIEIKQEELRQWLLHYLLPVFIWQLTLRRVPLKKKNERLIKYYKGVLQKARDKLKDSDLEKVMSPEKYQRCLQWASQTARTFQRSSSQVEGRNGYLAFVHKANRGMPYQRLQVLTVVHNFDIRSWDGKTPAERLFKQDFPDLFEFVLENVTSFPEPRKRKCK